MKEAKIFTRWVTSKVIPSIRKRGEYKLKQEIEENKKTLNRIRTKVKYNEF